MYALFNAGDLLTQRRGQLAFDELLVPVEASVVELAIMPAPWEFIPREVITGQGVLGA